MTVDINSKLRLVICKFLQNNRFTVKQSHPKYHFVYTSGLIYRTSIQLSKFVIKS